MIIIFSASWFLAGINSVYAPCTNDESSCGDIRPLPTPLNQLKQGIQAKDVLCHDGFTLVIKSENGSPACVHPSSMARMVRQGWWAWDEKVGDTIVNTPDKKPLTKVVPSLKQYTSIIGTKGFVKDDLPPNGITYPG